MWDPWLEQILLAVVGVQLFSDAAAVCLRSVLLPVGNAWNLKQADTKKSTGYDVLALVEKGKKQAVLPHPVLYWWESPMTVNVNLFTAVYP